MQNDLQNHMKRISCIIPAYNEGPRIENVLKVLEHHSLIDEIIVIDDGSIDNTREIVSLFKNIILVEHKKNQGKSKTICTGIQKSKNELLLMLDADLVGIRPEDITALIEPVIRGVADVSISLRRNAPLVFRIIGLDYISGERVLSKKILSDNLEKIASLPKFGLESFINKMIIKNKYRIKVVRWENVESPYKNVKRGFFTGVKDEILMIRDIFNTIGIWGPIFQIIKISKLKVK